MTAAAVQRIVDALRGGGFVVKNSGGAFQAQCPAHEDSNPSLAINARKSPPSGAVIFCHAGCHYSDVLKALGLTDADLFDDARVVDVLGPTRTYVYSGGRKNHRKLGADGAKTFWQEGAGDRSLYGIDRVGDASTVFLCEGEKGADFMSLLGYAAVATGGAERTCDVAPLAGRVVIIIADRDEAGYRWAARYATLLGPVASTVCVTRAKVDIARADIVEHVAAGFTVADLEKVPPISTNGHKEGMTAESVEELDVHETAVAHKAYELRLADEARALWNRQRAELMGQEPPVMVAMEDFLAVPDEDAQYRVDGLFPVGARVLLTAQYKAGKTSLIANLLRCLVDGDQFLGKFAVNPIERVLLIDTELDERTLRRWLREQTVRNIGGINIMSLRGRLASFGITDDRTRAEWAEKIAGAELIMLDCLRPCLDALGLSEDKEAGVFLTAFDALCREAGAGEAVVVHHMGHTQERSRGDSRLLDWPDALWKLVRDTDEEGADNETGDRFFSAIGRDVQVDESQLFWQPETRMLTVCGGNRMEKKAHGAVDDIIEIMVNPANADGLSQTQLVAKLKVLGVGRNVARAAVRQAVNDGVLLISAGPREAKIHVLNPSWRKGGSEGAGI